MNEEESKEYAQRRVFAKGLREKKRNAHIFKGKKSFSFTGRRFNPPRKNGNFTGERCLYRVETCTRTAIKLSIVQGFAGGTERYAPPRTPFLRRVALCITNHPTNARPYANFNTRGQIFAELKNYPVPDETTNRRKRVKYAICNIFDNRVFTALNDSNDAYSRFLNFLQRGTICYPQATSTQSKLAQKSPKKLAPKFIVIQYLNKCQILYIVGYIYHFKMMRKVLRNSLTI